MPVRLTRDERRAQTRADLLDAAGRVFVERGFEGTSIEAISEEAGYTRGAFYSNFQSKEQLFAELLQRETYSQYTRMAEREVPATLREAGERLAQIQAEDSGQWLFRLWLELLAAAGRDSEFRKTAAGFWSTNRKLTAAVIQASYDDRDAKPPLPAEDLASAMIAMDIGLALQHFVDPEAAPLDLYPELYELLFSNV